MVLPLQPVEGLPLPIGINVGGEGPAVDGEGRIYQPDRAYRRANGAGYRAKTEKRAVTSACVAEPFRSMREGEIAYHIDITPGMYRITLAFCEPAWTVPNARVFDVCLNDYLVLQDFDPAAEYGAEKPVQQAFLFRVAGKGLKIHASGIVGEPILSSIYVERVLVDDSVPEPPTITDVVARDGVVCLAWKSAPGQAAARYEVWRSDGRDKPFVKVAVTGGAKARFVDRLVQNCRNYCYVVVSLDAESRHRGSSAPVRARPHMPTDAELLDMTARAAFRFFVEECDPETYLTRDKNVARYISTAAVGFGLSALCAGAERAWIPRDDAEQRCFTMLATLNARDDNKRHGMFFHYLNGDGSRSKEGYEDAVSTIDTALLAWGALAAGEYFEGRVKEQADLLIGRINWRAYADDDRKLIRMAWKPDPEKGDAFGQFYSAWDWYSDEAILVALLAISAPNPEFRVGPEYYFAFNRPRGDYNEFTDIVYTWPGTLFTYTFAHSWLDFRRLGPDGQGFNAWENTRKAILANRAYCLDLAKQYKTFGPNSWGLTASSGKDGYCVAGAPPCGGKPNPGGGTIALFSAGMSMPFVPDLALAALRHYYTFHDAAGYRRLWKDEFEGGYGFIDSYSLDLDFFSPEIHGINHGPMLMLLENHRSDFFWKLMLRNATVRFALRQVGFSI